MTKGDKILIITAVAITTLIWAGYNYFPTKPNQLVAVVSVDGEEISRLPVNADTMAEITITIPRGEATIEYGQGKVRVLPLDHVTCPNEICWRTGWITTPGQSIVCLPNRMVITLEGKISEFDSILR